MYFSLIMKEIHLSIYKSKVRFVYILFVSMINIIYFCRYYDSSLLVC